MTEKCGFLFSAQKENPRKGKGLPALRQKDGKEKGSGQAKKKERNPIRKACPPKEENEVH